MTYVLVANVTFSGVSSVNIDNCFSADYTHYLTYRTVTGTTLDATQAVLRSGGTSDTSANYDRNRAYAGGGTFGTNQFLNETDAEGFFGIQDTSGGQFHVGLISNPFDAVITTFWTYFTNNAAAGSIRADRQAHEHSLASSYDGIGLIAASGTITGKVLIYGLKE